MSPLNLSIDELLTTTRTVRKRLDLTRPVEAEVIAQCLQLAVQAPTAGVGQNWHFLVITEPAQRKDLAELYRKGWETNREFIEEHTAAALAGDQAAMYTRVGASAHYLLKHLHEVPVHVIPCIEGRSENLPVIQQAGLWGSIMPATWSFMLAARSRGLGTSLTSYHLFFEREAAEILSIPYEQIMQTALIPVAYTIGDTFKPAVRKPLDEVLHWNRW
ncbi:putative oxidoreductase [Ktedonobacter sp. SOSP1-52]|uniref:nitroreductase family protein n=1 Tax=Ktedonobacter sp. SOSP1-52 TaxID=2778366 RepID=UPI001916C983|nr:nitroreductase family protein [Ktedonobacter sp. SOSP1-52]GHO62613.1 putative oxidoreductase [Ktedonobacter sp. SOSP1-52]